MRVARAWARVGLQPYRVERYIPSNDFKGKADDVIALYLYRPQHTVIFTLDEKTAIQALDRRDPVLPMSPSRAERHGFEFVRKGTLSLFAALNTKTGAAIGQTAPRHTSEELVAFLGAVVVEQPAGQEMHIILDNVSAQTRRVTEFLTLHQTVHFTPTYSSWLSQVELWFSKIERDLIIAAVSSPPPLTFTTNSCAKSPSTKAAQADKWKYSDTAAESGRLMRLPHPVRATRLAGRPHNA
jgi:transposase